MTMPKNRFKRADLATTKATLSMSTSLPVLSQVDIVQEIKGRFRLHCFIDTVPVLDDCGSCCGIINDVSMVAMLSFCFFSGHISSWSLTPHGLRLISLHFCAPIDH
jgi:hypothetical protein